MTIELDEKTKRTLLLLLGFALIGALLSNVFRAARACGYVEGVADTVGQFTAVAVDLNVQGRVRGTPDAHNVVQLGSTPSPATTTPQKPDEPGPV
ncbi:MAG TPA: hypothetical protein PKA41_18080 [Verrucomicrobiota bacterium]|nr:hypothetical protein [Verrucomicrobiota bacterium]